MSTIRVIVADDHWVMRDAVRALLESAPDISVVGTASNGEEALRLVQDLAPDVLLLDMVMPRLGGLEVTQRLQEDDSEVQVLALSSYHDVEYVRGVKESGAAGYLTKEEAPEALIDAVRAVCRGEEKWPAHYLDRANSD